MIRNRTRGLRLFRGALLGVIALGSFTASRVAMSASSPDADAPAGWLAQVQQGIAASEYHVTWQNRTALPDLDAAWQAPNRAQGFRTYFTDSGTRVVPRASQDPEWEWSLSLAGYGRAGRSWLVPEASVSTMGNRVEYGRGSLVEWYENDPWGLKQGFTLPAAPEELAGWIGALAMGRDAGKVVRPGRGREVAPAHLIHLDLALSGPLSPVIATDGQAIDFVAPGGARVIRYAALAVTDATGRALPAWMEGVAGGGIPGGRGIRLVIDSREAVYPLTVDPLATSPAWTAESDQGQAYFGGSVATAGDVNGDGYSDVIVGAGLYDNGEINEGRAFVYLGSAAGLSTTADWLAESNQAGAEFGNSVATAGDVNGDGYADVIVGAHMYDNGASNEGRAYVYLGSPAGLIATEHWTAESDQDSARFGNAVATAGDVNRDGYTDVIVGAVGYDNGESNEGRAYVYLGSAAGLSAVEDWTAEGGQVTANFASSVSTAGDVDGDGYADVIVGAPSYDNGQDNEGRAYVYLGSAGGLSAVEAWTAESNQEYASLGNSVAAAGDVNGDGYADVIVGASAYDGGETNEGRAYVYLGSAAGLLAGPGWVGESDQASAAFGSAVGTAGDVNGDGYADVIVGARAYANGETDEGRAYVYLGSAAGVSATAYWTAESDQATAHFGSSVSTAGDVNSDGYADVIVGAFWFDNGESNEGRAFVYLGSAAGLSAAPGWSAEGEQGGAYFGFSVSTAGDVNGDGYADVIVGALRYDNGEADEGRAYVYPGSATGLATIPSWLAESDQANALFGYSVSTAGDVNGDGYADIVVGALRYQNGETEEGRTYVYLGSGVGLSSTPDWTAEANQAFAEFGYSVSTAGDVNGDGYADVIVGARLYDNGDNNEGRAYVYPGLAAGLSPTPIWIAESDQASAYYGSSVSTAGDVNADGYADVIVGAPSYANGENAEGRVYVYLGSAAGLSTTPNWTSEGNQIGAQLGNSVSTAGDVNGDGFSECIIGAYRFDNGGIGHGRAYVYLGSGGGLSLTPHWTAEGAQVDADLGHSVSTAGDVNGDGYADVIVGEYRYENGQANEGRAHVYLGSAAGLSTTPDWTAESDQAEAYLGCSVSTAGDVNGDGCADVIVGAFKFDNGESDEGRAFVYYGNASTGLSVVPQQRRSDDLAPISPGLRSLAPEFRLGALGRTPFGRGRVKLEWEVKPMGTVFDGTGTGQSADWMDTGVAGAALSELITSQPGGALHWRARFLYAPVTSPFAQASRWFTVPWNGWNETDLVMTAFVGGVVWEDRDGDGIRDGGEPAIGGVALDLLDGTATLVNATVTAGDGSYLMAVPGFVPVKMRVLVPGGFRATTADQGIDDLVDSDVSPVTYETPLIGPDFSGLDPVRWSAGLRQVGVCFAPDEPLFIEGVRLVGTATVLDIQDFNQPEQVSGYNIYRSSDAGLDPALWPLLASDIVDGDGATPNIQYADDTGDASPTGLWYYEAAAYNGACDAEGPW